MISIPKGKGPLGITWCWWGGKERYWLYSADTGIRG